MVVALWIAVVVFAIGTVGMAVLAVDNANVSRQWVERAKELEGRNKIQADDIRGLRQDLFHAEARADSARIMNPQATLIDQVIEKEATELEHARAAYYRLTHALANDLSAETSGAGPLFSSSKFKVAERSVEALFGGLAGDDWETVDLWIRDHPDQWEKLR